MFWKIFRRGHQRYRDLLSEYLDGRLDVRDVSRLEEHLGRCDECTQELESLRATVGLLQRVRLVEPPRSFQLHEVPVQRPTRPVFMWAMQISTAAAAFLLAALLAGDLLGAFGDGAAPTVDETTVAQEGARIEVAKAPEPTPTLVPAPAAAAMAAEEEAAPPSEDAGPEIELEQEAAALAAEEEPTPSPDVAQPEIEMDQEATPAAPVSEEERDEAIEPEEEDGDSLVRKFEIAVGALLGFLALATAYITYRRRRAST